MATPIRFDFTCAEDTFPALRRCVVSSRGEKTTCHLGLLDQLADRLNVTEYARENAKRLATGYQDLIVVLLEPTDKAEDVGYIPMFNASNTLRFLDMSLRHAFDWKRCVDNTIVLDIRSFRSDRIKKDRGRT